MDGNARWARRHALPVSAGHAQGVEALRRVVAACLEWGIPALTVRRPRQRPLARPPPPAPQPGAPQPGAPQPRPSQARGRQESTGARGVAARAPGRLPERGLAAQVYGLSADNLRRRGAPELGALLTLVEGALGRELAGLRSRGVRLRFPGERALLPASVRAVAARCAAPEPLHGARCRALRSRRRPSSAARERRLAVAWQGAGE